MTTTTLARSDGPTQFDAAAWLEEHAAGDILMTPDGWMTEANRPARRIFRLPGGQDVRGLSFRRFCRQPARFAETVQAIRTAGYVGSWDADLVAFDGRPVHAVVNLVGDFEAGFLTAIRAQIFDISDWRRSQERTLFGQRIEAIGRLAGGVAHDFNNLLTVISGHAECLSVALAPDSPMNRSVVAIQASAARAATLTEKLLSFGRRQVLQPHVIDLADLTRRVEATLRRAVGHIPGTALPGEPGNVGLTGHRDTFFRPLKDLRIKDEIQFSTLEGDFKYEVESLRVVEPDNVGVLAPSGENVLTMVTCYPFYYVGPAPKRWIVRARQVVR